MPALTQAGRDYDQAMRQKLAMAAEEDALKIVLSLNKELKMSLLSLSAVIIVDKLELK